jgi:hypothetical protein
VSILNVDYAEHFGFTQNDVDEIIKYYELEKHDRSIKKWYDGYLFGNTEIYNPWSIIRAIQDLCINPKDSPKAYWANTSSNEIVKRLVKTADVSAKGEIETLNAGTQIEKTIHEDVTYDDMEESSGNLWNFLFFTGYLTKAGEQRDKAGNLYVRLKIPNKEVAYIFNRKVREWFDEQVRARDLSELYGAIINGDTESIVRNISSVLGDTISLSSQEKLGLHHH